MRVILKISKIMGIILAILMLLLMVYNYNAVVFADELDILQEQNIIKLKELVRSRLLNLINKEEFKSCLISHYVLFHPEFIINEKDIDFFMEKLPWPDIIEKFMLDCELVLKNINEVFVDYSRDVIKKKYVEYSQKNTQANANTINSLNYMIENFTSFIKNNGQLVGWFFGCSIIYKMYVSDFESLFIIIHNLHTSYPENTYIQILLDIIPRLKAYISINNTPMELNNIPGDIVTSNAKIAVQNSIKVVADNPNTNIIIIGGAVCVGVVILGLKYFLT